MTNDKLNKLKYVCSLYDINSFNLINLYVLDNNYYIMEWIDIEDNINIFNIFKVNISLLNDYVNNQFPLSIIYESLNNFYKIVKNNTNYEIKEKVKSSPLSPHLYDMYFNEDECKDYDFVKKYIKNKLRKEKFKNIMQ